MDKFIPLQKAKTNFQSEVELRHSLAIFGIVTIIVLIVLFISGAIITTKNNQLLINPLAGVFKEKEQEVQFNIKKHIIQSGEVFSNLTASLGFTAEQTQEIFQSSQEVYNLANIRAGNSIQAFFDPQTNEFKKMVYNIDEVNFLLVQNTVQGLIAEKQQNEYEIELTKISGIVKDSFYMAGKNSGLADKTIMEMADIFSWDIDFGFDVRVGDNFDIFYEKRFLDGQEIKPGKILIARYQNQDENYYAIYFKDWDEHEDYYNLEGKNLRRQFLKSPLNYKYISSGFTYKRMHPILGRYTPHLGIDYAAATGTPVSASGAGTIISAGWKYGIGKTVIIRHNEVYTTRYSHLSSYARGIKYGAKVSQGQVVGYVGNTGEWSAGAHLEYAMSKYGTPINPLNQNFKRSEPVKKIYQADFNSYQKELLRLLEEK
ncbi:peptidoglycan DD-metalloendopeptidase family protein [Patescibacteria group bacterium]|nr:peptidoglycan DD-metalloendopeptidase family protein [Patescibacteria group bacterium]